jgi:hypothetical protein
VDYPAVDLEVLGYQSVEVLFVIHESIDYEAVLDSYSVRRA